VLANPKYYVASGIVVVTKRARITAQGIATPAAKAKANAGP